MKSNLLELNIGDTSQDPMEEAIVSEDQLKLAAGKWILKIREGHRIPNSTMESIVLGAQSLFQLGLCGIEHSVIRKLRDSNVSPDVISSVTAILSEKNQYTDVYKGLETTHKQNEYIKTNFKYIVSFFNSTIIENTQTVFLVLQDPVSITFGVRHVPGKFLSDGSLKQIKDSMVYIPILRTIQQLLHNGTILAEVSNCLHVYYVIIMYHHVNKHVLLHYLSNT